MILYEHKINFIDNKVIVTKSRKYYLIELILYLCAILILYFIIFYPIGDNNFGGAGKLGYNFSEYQIQEWIFFFMPILLFIPLVLHALFKIFLGDVLIFDFKNNIIHSQSKDYSFSLLKNIQLKTQRANLWKNENNKATNRYKIIFKLDNKKTLKIINSNVELIFKLINKIIKMTKINFVNETILINPDK